MESAILAENADEEIRLLDSLNTKKTAIIHAEFKDMIPLEKITRDSTAVIELVSHDPQHLVYESTSKSPQLAIFSEVYYPKGWNAYINNEPAEYFRANYALRAMRLPAGNNKIEFKFEPAVVKTGSTVTLATSIVFVLLLLAGLFWKFKKPSEASTQS